MGTVSTRGGEAFTPQNHQIVPPSTPVGTPRELAPKNLEASIAKKKKKSVRLARKKKNKDEETPPLCSEIRSPRTM